MSQSQPRSSAADGVPRRPHVLNPIVDTEAGSVGGHTIDGIHRFVDIPYAAPPVGHRRFAAPQPAAPWTGLRDHRPVSASAPQQAPRIWGIDLAALGGEGWTRGDDYLTLNVWTPEQARGCPVMVWIHGGGCISGRKDTAVTDGTNFARSGVACIAINYRLGTEGFLPIPGAPTNLGLRDMIAALQWVQTNVEAFGGDPNNVTIFGESAGGMNVCALVASPLTSGLFSRAIVQSGHGSSAYPIHIAERTSARLAKILGISNDVAGFHSASSDAVLRAQRRALRPGRLDLRDEHGFDPGFGVGRYAAVHGDDVLPRSPIDLVRAGAGRDVELLIGTTAEEANLMGVPTRMDLLPKRAARWILSRSIADAADVLNAYGADEGTRRGGGALMGALTDLAFRWPARQFADAHHSAPDNSGPGQVAAKRPGRGSTHVFEFDWRSPRFARRLGACHGLDLPFVFNTLDAASGPTGIAGLNPPRALATRIHELWVRFAHDGSLPWPGFDSETREVFQLSAGHPISEPIPPAAQFVPVGC